MNLNIENVILNENGKLKFEATPCKKNNKNVENLKRFYEKHGNKILICECGGNFSYSRKNQHLKSKKHIFKMMEKKIKELEKI